MDISIEEYDALVQDVRALKILVINLRDTIEDGLYSNDIHSNAIQERHIDDGVITKDKITLTMDDIPNGVIYGKLLGTSITAGKVLLSQASGNLDDLADGTYGKLLSTSLSSGLALLSACDGDFDDITNGTTYGKVKVTNISAGNILLAECTGNLDNIANGATYGKVALTSISAGKIIVAGLDSGITDRMFSNLNTKNNVEAWRHTSDITLIDGGNIYTNSLTLASAANDYNWSSLPDDGNKPVNNADVTGSNTAADIVNLPATPSGAGLFANGTYIGYYDSISWKAYIQNNGYFYFGGDANNYVQWAGSTLNIKGNIVITGGSGIASLTDAGDLATKDEVANTDLGTTIISGGYLRTDLIKVKKVYVGGGSNEDIIFEDSGIRFYDASSNELIFSRSGYASMEIWMQSSARANIVSGAQLGLKANNDIIMLPGSSYGSTFYTTGTLQLPKLTNAPTAHNGDITGKEGNRLLRVYNTADGAWYHSSTASSGW